MEGLDEGTVDFVPTYNNEEEEPDVFPGLFPNLLANGSTGIAVGMATSIPSHNVAEVIDAALELIDNPHVDARAADGTVPRAGLRHRRRDRRQRRGDLGSLRDRPRRRSGCAGGSTPPRVKDEADREAGIERLGGGQYQLVISEIPTWSTRAG